MKATKTLLLSIILLCLIVGCEDKKSHKVEEIDADIKKDTKVLEVPKVSEISEVPTVSYDLQDTFALSGAEEKSYRVNIHNKNISSNDISHPIVLINIFATWCLPCLGEIPYLAALQQKHKDNLFVMGILIDDKQNIHSLQDLIGKYKINYFISNSKQNDTLSIKLSQALQLPKNFSLPLTIVYKRGKYYTHYEGSVPIEMIDHDIQQAIKE